MIMAAHEEASPICRGKNLSWETVMLFFNYMPKEPMPKDLFNSYVEKNINSWTQTHSQIARQLAFYYEDNGICYPRFNKSSTLSDLFNYMVHWAHNYFIPNPYAPSLRGKSPTSIYSHLVKCIERGIIDFDTALDSLFDVALSSHDKVKVYLQNYSNIKFDQGVISLNDSLIDECQIMIPTESAAIDPKQYFLYYDKGSSTIVGGKYRKEISEKNLQQIYFGAPGTGKSHEIKAQIERHKSFRITFHPDTDYSSFVGAYKPTSVEVPMLTTLGDKAIPMKDVDGNELTENKIIYTYVKQAFLNAYIESWKERENENPQPVFLVIEEINRGNCAQIFGDIFQLLDRNDAGFSDYAIVPDTDLSRHVKKDLEKLVIADRDKINAIYEECEADMVDKVLKGEVLLLPNNLYIWATMNTSDQSLFPIDSAFKRRWDWKYIKIADAHKNWQINVGAKNYDWWQFVQAINCFVFDATQSEDKNLGYFFAKAKNGIINAETFVSKVIFYLYTDVFKDYGFSGDIFKGANGEEMTFQSFYNADGFANEVQIACFIENVIYSDALPETLKVANTTEDEDMNVYDEDEAVDNRQSSNRDKFMVNGVGSYGKCLAPFEAVKAYSEKNPQMNAAEIVQVWSNLNVNHMPHLVETEQEFEERAKTTKDIKFRVKAKRLELPNGEVIYVSNQFNPIRIAELIEKLNNANLGVNISLIES